MSAEYWCYTVADSLKVLVLVLLKDHWQFNWKNHWHCWQLARCIRACCAQAHSTALKQTVDKTGIRVSAGAAAVHGALQLGWHGELSKAQGLQER
jgi:hypothetical protein